MPRNEDRHTLSVAGELGQAIRHHADDQVIARYRQWLATDQAERALRRVLDAAPPLSATQIAQIRAVLADYDPDADTGRIKIAPTSPVDRTPEQTS